MRYDIVLTQDAARDLEDLYLYITTHDSRRSAEHLLDRLVAATASLEITPERGSRPKELRSLGDQEYRQVFFKPYRVIYRVIGGQVVVYLIADGRRDMSSLLARRLLRG
jgi:toxin ParE1/3/4